MNEPDNRPKPVRLPFIPNLAVSYGRPSAPPPTISFVGDYASWADAEKVSVGYSSPSILEKVRGSALKVKRGEAVFERDSVAFNQPHYRWPVTTCLLMIALRNRGHLHVADFGGSLGSTYSQHKAIFGEVPALIWSVIEQPHYVACGNDEFSDEVIQFFETFEGAANRAKIDVVLFSSSLQYVSDPYNVIRVVAERRVANILIDRFALTDRATDLIQVQYVREPIYNASYPTRNFARKPFLEFMSSIGYSMRLSFRGEDGPNYAGFFWSLRT
jgi:putative methyltransferase (TIGR04325 family)